MDYNYDIQLSKDELKALKYFKHLSGLTRLGVTPEVLDDRFSITSGKFIIDKFLELGLIKKFVNENFYILTDKGKQVLSYKRSQFSNKIFWNIIVPIVLSIVTAYITVTLT